MDYQQAWRFLDDLQFFKIKLGLNAMTTFLGRLGHPERGPRFVHIGGTNGKGSVGATLLSILSAAGYRVGLYTSPHLSSVRERFRINDRFIGEDTFAGLATRIAGVLGGDQITYFEFTTTLALLWFAGESVDLALLEVGMGGRLDATNVITPLVSVITNVSMDHEQYLGETLAAVAGEKAGIIKPGVPVVSGAVEPEAARVIGDRCRQLHSPLFLLGRDFSGQRLTGSGWRYRGIRATRDDLPLAMRGDYQVDNAALALAVTELLAEHGIAPDHQAITTGLARTRWPGRLEEFWQRGDQVVWQRPSAAGFTHFLLDGAHNPAGVQALVRTLNSEFADHRLLLIWGAMADKDLGTTLAHIAPLADLIWFARPESERSATPGQLRDTLAPDLRGRARLTESVASALAQARNEAGENDLICVAGSLYLVGQARRLLLGEVVHL